MMYHSPKSTSGFEMFFWIIVLFLGASAVFGVQSCSCETRAKKMGFESDYEPFQGCMVKTTHGWRDIGAVREVK